VRDANSPIIYFETLIFVFQVLFGRCAEIEIPCCAPWGTNRATTNIVYGRDLFWSVFMSFWIERTVFRVQTGLCRPDKHTYWLQ